jgi:hypothetical protein
MNELNFYFCFTCGRSICQVCASFIHKNHDKNYVGKLGTCVHDNDSNPKTKDKTKVNPSIQNSQYNNMYSFVGRNVRKANGNE